MILILRRSARYGFVETRLRSASCHEPAGTDFSASLCQLPGCSGPATTEAKRVRFNQLNSETGNRVQQQLIDSQTGEVVDRDQIVKGYEYERGRYVTIDDDELKALQIESSKIIDLERFVDRDEVDPVYLDAPYYVYPDGELAAETFRVIGEAMEHKNKVGLGRVTMSGRERLVLVEPRDGGLVMSTVRSADEVRPAEFGLPAKGEIDPDMVGIAETIIDRRSGHFDPASFRDRYQDALRELVAQKTKGEGHRAARGGGAAQGHQSDGGAEAQPGAGREGTGAGKGSHGQTQPAHRPPPTGVKGRCCCRYRADAKRRKSLRRSPPHLLHRGAERLNYVGQKLPLTPTLSPQAGRGRRREPLAPPAGRGRGPRSGEGEGRRLGC